MYEDVKPDPEAKQTPIEAFYHLFQLRKFSWETDLEYREREVVREDFIRQLRQQGMDPAAFLARLSE
jgi:hypothetical protein